MNERIQTALDIITPLRWSDKGDGRNFAQMCAEAAARHGKIGKPVVGEVLAYVNYSRWVADCLNCSAGMALQPGVNQVVCLECGERYDVTWPKDREAIEALLLLRPQRNRHWRPGETIEDLERENREHGIEPHCGLCRQGR